MKCQYLQGTYLLLCKASRDVYIPSHFEFIEYCTHTRHAICPYFLRSPYEEIPAEGYMEHLMWKAR